MAAEVNSQELPCMDVICLHIHDCSLKCPDELYFSVIRDYLKQNFNIFMLRGNSKI